MKHTRALLTTQIVLVLVNVRVHVIVHAHG